MMISVNKSMPERKWSNFYCDSNYWLIVFEHYIDKDFCWIPRRDKKREQQASVSILVLTVNVAHRSGEMDSVV